jgi:hypothetical protein
MKQLAILIPTLPVRVMKYARLITKLNKQIIDSGLIDKVQIVSFCDSKEYLVGFKRNKLVELSLAKYICFVDDDDDISDNYVNRLYSASLSGVDCVTFWGEYRSSFQTKNISFNLDYKHDSETSDCFMRYPNHLSLVKREIALKCPFPLKNFGEDYEYSLLLKKHLKSQIHIQEKLYFYNFNSSTSQTDSSSKSNQFQENIK